MTIGVALVLIAIGAILRFAVATVSTHGFDVHTIGDILMVVGVAGLIIWMFVWAPWVRSRRPGHMEPPRVEDDPPRVYRSDGTYEEEPHYRDHYPR